MSHARFSRPPEKADNQTRVAFYATIPHMHSCFKILYANRLCVFIEKIAVLEKYINHGSLPIQNQNELCVTGAVLGQSVLEPYGSGLTEEETFIDNTEFNPKEL